MAKSPQYDFTIKHRVNITENSSGVGHLAVFDTVEEASLHISQWINKAESIQYFKEWIMNKDLEIYQARDEKRKELVS